jgi:hypothetical protein
MKYKRTKVLFIDMRRFFPETIYEDIKTRDVDAAKDRCPAGCCCFKFCDQEYEKATTEEGELLEVKHEDVNHSYNYYMPPNELFTLEDLKRLTAINPDKYRIALSNMRNNGYTRVVQTRTGNLCPLNEHDVLL